MLRDNTLKEAYRVMHQADAPDAVSDWEFAQELLAEWNVPLLGEDLAKRCLFQLINHIPKESDETKMREIIGAAEEKLPELFPEIGLKDPDMHVAEWLEYTYREQKEQPANSELKNNIK